MPDYTFDTRYEVQDGEGASLIDALTHGRLAPIVLKLELDDGRSTRAELVGIDRERNTADLERGAEALRNFDCTRLVAVTMIDTEPPLDQSDELRG